MSGSKLATERPSVDPATTEISAHSVSVGAARLGVRPVDCVLGHQRVRLVVIVVSSVVKYHHSSGSVACFNLCRPRVQT